MSDCDCDDITLLGPQVLGVRGDVAYDEYGNYALSIGELDIVIPFVYEKATVHYRFEYLYVTDTGTPPQDIRAVVVAQTATNFTVRLSGAPTSTGAVLSWHVMRPDPLHANQPITITPVVYGIIRAHQQGVTALVSGQDFINVTFPVAQPDNDWVFEALSIENQTDPQVASQIFSYTVSVHTINGFRLDLSGTPDNNFYVLRWKVA